MNFHKYLKIFLTAAALSVLLFFGLYLYGIHFTKLPARENLSGQQIVSESGINSKDINMNSDLNKVRPVELGDNKTEDKTVLNQEMDLEKIPAGIIAATGTEILKQSATGSKKDIILYKAPFTSQSPFAEWSDPRQQDGCEEAASLMAVRWARGEALTAAEAKDEILAISAFELENYGSYIDTSASATAERIIAGYFKYNNYAVEYDIGLDDIVRELENGNLLIMPMNGRALDNPYYTPPGPDRHMLLVKGYDYNTGEFITNDNGTRHGEDYRYDQNVFFNAIRDYPSGNGVSISGDRKAMIIVRVSIQ